MPHGFAILSLSASLCSILPLLTHADSNTFTAAGEQYIHHDDRPDGYWYPLVAVSTDNGKNWTSKIPMRISPEFENRTVHLAPENWDTTHAVKRTRGGAPRH